MVRTQTRGAHVIACVNALPFWGFAVPFLLVLMSLSPGLPAPQRRVSRRWTWGCQGSGTEWPGGTW